MVRVVPLVLIAACARPPEGLLPRPDGTGPMVTVDWDRDPLPELPFPNDLATRPDPTSVTGLRLNISEEAKTHSEREAREKLNELVGFGIFSPITVSFEAALDLDNIAGRHPNDFHVPGHKLDDAIYVVNVDPDSPDYLEPVALDMGHGRFPADVARTDRYFPNDSRAQSPSVMFDTIDEDVDGDGVMDWGEDLDNDGVLDVPNVYPEGGDPRDDLLTFYDREQDMLIARPIVPLREETTYAVILTNRLVGLDGEPVRSPWEYVNHTRQTEAVAPIEDFLPRVGLALDDVAFTWSFTTGRVTGDLVDLHDGLFAGTGPWPTLATDFPPGVTEALQTHAKTDGSPEDWRLPVDDLIGPLVDLGLFDEEAGEFMVRSYGSFADVIVAGAFTTPYLLADRDDGGNWDADEWWQLDPVAGTISAEPQRVAFSCVLPKEDPAAGVEQPFPVVMFGHGYGSSRFDFLGFAHAFNRMGFAACAMDFPGHGPTVDEDQLPLITSLLAAQKLDPFLYHLQDSRYRDLDNDGVKDSGGDQWSADSFHTRDMVRQAAVDWMQMVRSFQACGTGEMERVSETAAGPVATGEAVASCDWDGDGTPDIGGTGVDYFIVGGSLGGIDGAVAAGVIPEVTAWSAIVPGGGTLDIGIRTEIGGAVEALIGRLVTPMFLGTPQADGSLQVVQMVNSVMDMRTLPVGTIPSIPARGKIVITNLDNGEVREGFIPEDGRFRVSIAADGLDPYEKREAAGMPLTGPVEGQTYEVAGNEGLGDRLVVEVYDEAGTLVQRLDTWAADVVHEGVTMRAGTPLVAGSHGTGHIRASAKLRKVAVALSSALEPGDAISYAPRYHDDPAVEPINMMIVPTPGDSIVNVNTGIALARAAGLVPWRKVDERYGTTVDQWLIDRKVVQGLEQYGPYTNSAGQPVLFDADDLDNGTDGLEAPSDAPLRSVRTTSSGTSALRLPYVKTTGTHGFALPNPSLPFDINTFAIHQIAWYFATRGQEVSDDPCLATADCDFLRPWPTEAE